MSAQQEAILNLATLLKLDPALGDELRDEGELMPSGALLEADGVSVAEPLHWKLTVRATGSDDFSWRAAFRATYCRTAAAVSRRSKLPCTAS